MRYKLLPAAVLVWTVASIGPVAGRTFDDSTRRPVARQMMASDRTKRPATDSAVAAWRSDDCQTVVRMTATADSLSVDRRDSLARFDPVETQLAVLRSSSDDGEVVLEVAGSADSFRLAWECARPNAVVTVVALYDGPQTLPLPDMYGKNLTFKTGGVDGCDCAEILRLIEEGKIDTTPLITHTYPLEQIAQAYDLFEQRRDGVIKVAIQP